jgi:LPXTG-motif cell wall-anchored protein
MEDFGNSTSGFDLGSLLDSATKLATTGATVYGTITNKSAPPQKTAVQTNVSSNSTLYIVGGVVVALLVGALFFMRRGR